MAEPTGKIQHYLAYHPKPFLKCEREKTTLVFGGLTFKHERLIQGILENLGYNTEVLPQITKDDLIFGREYVDVGACCPTTFTTGNLARFLMEKMKKEGRDAVQKNYIFVTAGSCGPCRFGQYHVSYETALDYLGLSDFRILLLAQDQFSQKIKGGGLELNENLALGILMAIMMADILQDLEYKIRPYEKIPGKTNETLKESIEFLYHYLREMPRIRGTLNSVFFHLFSDFYRKGLEKVKEKWEKIEVDWLRVKPKVKITGEFWVQIHEGEGNYNIKSWLEKEGAEVLPPNITTWFDHLFYTRAENFRIRRKISKTAFFKEKLFRIISFLLNSKYNQFRKVFKNIPDPLPPQRELEELAQPFFFGRLGGGESFMLIGKALYSFLHKKSHMICELSPYSCMPNTMSQGSMASVLGKYPQLLYAPIEIKGDTEIHALSRCQMIFHSAKEWAKEEFERALSETNLTIKEIRRFERRITDLKNPFYTFPEEKYICRAANYVLHIRELMNKKIKKI